jgi:type IX secretion system PorP/SprF family membrane protein
LKISTRFTFFILLLFSRLQGQDIHFSMFYASPLTLNPALTGANDGTYRVAGIYRNQWQSISTPFSTYAASFDIKLLQEKLKNDIFGVGALLVGDKSGDGKLSMTSALLSAAFHKGLDKNHHHFIGVGVQAAFTQMSIKWNDLTFPDQFDASQNGFNLGQSNQENVMKPTINYFDLHAGILQQSTIKDIVGIMTGFSVFHLVEPNESFLGSNVKLADRFVVHEGLRFKVIKNFYITPNFIFQYQDKAQEINFGTAFEYHIPTAASEFVGSIGAWYRVNDAPIINASIEYYKVRLMFAYDITTSQLKPATDSRGAFELAVIFTGIIKSKSLDLPVLVPCPRM